MRLRQTYYDHKFARLAKKFRGYPRGRSSQKGKWDLFKDLNSGSSSELFLGVYGDLAIMDLLGEFGLFEALTDQGISDPCLDLDLSDAYRHILRLFDKAISPETLIAELVFRRSRWPHSTSPELDIEPYPCLHLEWILLQNPYRRFDSRHPALPQQDCPGLALGDMTLSLIAAMAKNLRMGSVSTVPASLHSALFFLRSYSAVSSKTQADLLALKRAAKRFGRIEVVWAEEWGDLLVDDTHEIYKWEPSELVQPLNEDLKAWFAEHVGETTGHSGAPPRFVIREGVRAERRADGSVIREYQSAVAKTTTSP
ncbi:MAG: hypothetical protein JSW54_04825 [Fidelibacterota bacterium]|nr:MAG: hypothetical protein JSW54_04825 [Candidatus Neomarinimicrobiota bacterium]